MSVVLVTGAAGLLGGVLARVLDTAGHRVVATGRRPGAGPAGIEYRPCELADAGAVASLLAAARPDAIVHAAGRIRAEYGVADSFLRDNVDATANLVTAGRAAGVERFIFCSSISVYRGDGPFAETAPATAPDPYGASKRRAEELCLAVGTVRAPTIVLRLGGLHGHPRHDGVVHAFFEAAARSEPLQVSEPETVTTLTFFDDVAGAVLAALTHVDLQPALVCNVATAEVVTMRALAESVRSIVGGTSRIEPAASARRRNRVLETAQLRAKLGYRSLTLADHLSRFGLGK